MNQETSVSQCVPIQNCHVSEIIDISNENQQIKLIVLKENNNVQTHIIINYNRKIYVLNVNNRNYKNVNCDFTTFNPSSVYFSENKPEMKEEKVADNKNKKKYIKVNVSTDGLTILNTNNNETKFINKEEFICRIITTAKNNMIIFTNQDYISLHFLTKIYLTDLLLSVDFCGNDDVGKYNFAYLYFKSLNFYECCDQSIIDSKLQEYYSQINIPNNLSTSKPNNIEEINSVDETNNIDTTNYNDMTPLELKNIVIKTMCEIISEKINKLQTENQNLKLHLCEFPDNDHLE